MAHDSLVPRLQLFEFHDQSWYPRILRSALTEYLRVLWEYSQAATLIAPILLRLLKETDSEQIIDLCSGGSGPMIPIQRQLEAQGIVVPILATDKFPDTFAMAELARQTGGRINGTLESIDATCLPDRLKGVRTLFNSFHHFEPGLARNILRDAYRTRQPIAIFEITERAPVKVALSFPATLISVCLLLARMRPWRLTWWLFTWIVPIVPISIGWDGLVSHLRAYTDVELSSLVDGFDENYAWEMGRLAAPRGGVRISYIIGRPSN